MKINLGIRERIIASILLIALILFGSIFYLVNQINQRDKLLKEISVNYQPSLFGLFSLKENLEESGKIVKYRAISSPVNDSVFEAAFLEIFSKKIPPIADELIRLSGMWKSEDQELLTSTLILIIDKLYVSYNDFIKEIYKLGAENNISNEIAEELLAEKGIIFLISEIEQNLNYLTGKKQQELEDKSASVIQKNVLKRNLIAITIIFTLLITGFVISTSRYINNFLYQLKDNLYELSHGRIPELMKIPEGSEFTTVIKNFNMLFDYLKNLSEVSKRIIKRDFSSDFKPLSKDDELGNLLINLQDNLKLATLEEENRKKEDEQRTWYSAGIARINDIIRFSNDNIDELSYQLIRELVSYTGSKIGAVYKVNKDDLKDQYIEIIASYAYDRKKYINKKILLGEGLIGSCIRENESTYLSEVPKGYLSIKSGLGENDPVGILIVPLHTNDNAFGAIELASFHEFAPYQIRFVETCGENIATAVSKSVKK